MRSEVHCAKVTRTALCDRGVNRRRTHGRDEGAFAAITRPATMSCPNDARLCVPDTALLRSNEIAGLKECGSRGGVIMEFGKRTSLVTRDGRRFACAPKNRRAISSATRVAAITALDWRHTRSKCAADSRFDLSRLRREK